MVFEDFCLYMYSMPYHHLVSWSHIIYCCTLAPCWHGWGELCFLITICLWFVWCSPLYAWDALYFPYLHHLMNKNNTEEILIIMRTSNSITIINKTILSLSPKFKYFFCNWNTIPNQELVIFKDGWNKLCEERIIHRMLGT